MRRARAGASNLLIAAVCAVTAAACGSVAAPAGTGTSGTGTSQQAAKVSLDIAVSHGHGTTVKHWTLNCQPASGTEPDPATACRVLLHAKDPFAPLRKGIMCPMIIVGSKVATVTGTWFGQRVDTTFTQGGCGLARWAEVGQIFN